MPTVCEAVCSALRGLLATSDAHREAAVGAGVLPLVVTALTKHATIPTLCEVACGLLGNISAGPLEDACVAAGCVPVVCAAIKAHLPFPPLCERAAIAMRNICASSDANRDAFIQAGAAHALVAILKTHPSTPPVCEAAGGALGNLAAGADPKRRDACAAAGALPALVTMLRVNEGLPGVALLAIRAMGSIALANEVHREALVQAGAIIPLVRAVEFHYTSQGVTEAVSAVLYNIAMSPRPANKEAIIAASAVPVLVKAAKAQPSARKNVVAALTRLGFNENGEKNVEAVNRSRAVSSMY